MAWIGEECASERLKKNMGRVHRLTPNPKARPRSAAPTVWLSMDRLKAARWRICALSCRERGAKPITARRAAVGGGQVDGG